MASPAKKKGARNDGEGGPVPHGGGVGPAAAVPPAQGAGAAGAPDHPKSWPAKAMAAAWGPEAEFKSIPFEELDSDACNSDSDIEGEYIAVEKIEDVLDDCPLVDQIWVHGSRYESCLVAVVVPNKGRLEAWAREQGIGGSFHELCADSQVKRMLRGELDSTGKQGGLKSFELPKALVVEPQPFTPANELLTPTMELRRQQLLQKYGKRVDELYAGMKKK